MQAVKAPALTRGRPFHAEPALWPLLASGDTGLTKNDRDNWPEAKGKLYLDGGDQLYVEQDDVEGWRHAVAALRQARPGIVIDTRTIEEWPGERLTRGTYETAAEHPDAGRPTHYGVPWFSEAERVRFESFAKESGPPTSF